MDFVVSCYRGSQGQLPSTNKDAVLVSSTSGARRRFQTVPPRAKQRIRRLFNDDEQHKFPSRLNYTGHAHSNDRSVFTLPKWMLRKRSCTRRDRPAAARPTRASSKTKPSTDEDRAPAYQCHGASNNERHWFEIRGNDDEREGHVEAFWLRRSAATQRQPRVATRSALWRGILQVPRSGTAEGLSAVQYAG